MMVLKYHVQKLMHVAIAISVLHNLFFANLFWRRYTMVICGTTLCFVTPVTSKFFDIAMTRFLIALCKAREPKLYKIVSRGSHPSLS